MPNKRAPSSDHITIHSFGGVPGYWTGARGSGSFVKHELADDQDVIPIIKLFITSGFTITGGSSTSIQSQIGYQVTETSNFSGYQNTSVGMFVQNLGSNTSRFGASVGGYDAPLTSGTGPTGNVIPRDVSPYIKFASLTTYNKSVSVFTTIKQTLDSYNITPAYYFDDTEDFYGSQYGTGSSAGTTDGGGLNGIWWGVRAETGADYAKAPYSMWNKALLDSRSTDNTYLVCPHPTDPNSPGITMGYLEVLRSQSGYTFDDFRGLFAGVNGTFRKNFWDKIDLVGWMQQNSIGSAAKSLWSSLKFGLYGSSSGGGSVNTTAYSGGDAHAMDYSNPQWGSRAPYTSCDIENPVLYPVDFSNSVHITRAGLQGLSGQEHAYNLQFITDVVNNINRSPYKKTIIPYLAAPGQSTISSTSTETVQTFTDKLITLYNLGINEIILYGPGTDINGLTSRSQIHTDTLTALNNFREYITNNKNSSNRLNTSRVKNNPNFPQLNGQILTTFDTKFDVFRRFT